MALWNLVPAKKFAVCETPRLLSRTHGDIKNQYPLNETDFASIPAENGMLLVVNEFDKTIDLPADATSFVYLHNSPVREYERLGKETVAVNLGEMLPVMYKLTKGDTIITNAVECDDAVYADVAAVKAALDATHVFGVPSAEGYIKLIATLVGTEKVALKAQEFTTLSNGREAIKFVTL